MSTATKNGTVSSNGVAQPSPDTKTKPAGPFAIARLNRQRLAIPIVGTTCLVLNRFANKQLLIDKHAQGDVGKKTRAPKPPKDFVKNFNDARHLSEEGWDGIHAAAFRNAMISACRLLGFPMTRAKLAVFTIADGIDVHDGSPLVKITKGEPSMNIAEVRNDSGVVDMRARPMWQPGWEAVVKVEFDADIFRGEDVINLLERAGVQVGIGEGRNDSKDSNGIGWGAFEIKR